MANYQVAVLGPIPRDHITTHNDEVVEKYGCVTHPVIALSKLMGPEARIIPVAHVRKRDKAAIENILSPHPGVEISHIFSKSDQGDVINLRFVDQNKRLEKQTAFMNPILPEDIEDILDSDVFVFVPVTDFEVPLETLKFIKAKSKGIIVFDAHGPTTTLTTRGDRLMKFWVDRDRWLPYIDVLKMNLEEANCSWFEKEYALGELERNEEIELHKLPDFARHCLSLGLKALYITLDSRGVMVYTMEDGELREELVPSVKVGKVVDTTGCGDSFAGGVAFGLLKDQQDFVKAARYGNALGAQRTQGKTFEVFKSLKETEKMIVENYGDN